MVLILVYFLYFDSTEAAGDEQEQRNYRVGSQEIKCN